MAPFSDWSKCSQHQVQDLGERNADRKDEPRTELALYPYIMAHPGTHHIVDSHSCHPIPQKTRQAESRIVGKDILYQWCGE